jgi:hypothetical protein
MEILWMVQSASTVAVEDSAFPVSSEFRANHAVFVSRQFGASCDALFG